jgi:hypothetical protein
MTPTEGVFFLFFPSTNMCTDVFSKIFPNYRACAHCRDLERWADGQLVSSQKYYGKGEKVKSLFLAAQILLSVHFLWVRSKIVYSGKYLKTSKHCAVTYSPISTIMYIKIFQK